MTGALETSIFIKGKLYPSHPSIQLWIWTGFYEIISKRDTYAQRGQPLLLDAVGIFMGIFMGQKIDLLGCIGTTRNLENQSQNPHWAICLPAIGLRVQPLQEI